MAFKVTFFVLWGSLFKSASWDSVKSYKFPKLGKKCKMVAIPTTSGTGSEVTSFAVISDKKKNMKYPLADYELTPDVAIVDSDLVTESLKNAIKDHWQIKNLICLILQ